jgi:hypothetical protein
VGDIIFGVAIVALGHGDMDPPWKLSKNITIILFPSQKCTNLEIDVLLFALQFLRHHYHITSITVLNLLRVLISFSVFPLGNRSVLPLNSYNATIKLTAKYLGIASI